MRELKLRTTEQYPQYRVETKRRNIDVYLRQDYHKQGDGIYWLMNPGTMLLSHYPQELKDNQKRLNSEKPLQDGEIVLIEGKQYRLKVLGDYSDAGIFEEITI